MTSSVLGIDAQTGLRVELPKTSRLQGLYIIGIQGYGKSGLIENLIIQDIKQNIGACVLDPHGELIGHVLARLDPKYEKNVILLDMTVEKYFFGLNLFACPNPTSDREIAKTLSQVLHVFEKAYGINRDTPLMYDLLYNSAYVLIANPGYTMIDIRLLLTNETCRKKLLRNVLNSDVRSFWERWDDPKLKSPKDQQTDSQTILNKLNDFSHDPLRYIVGQSTSTLNLVQIMEERKILLVKLDPTLENASSLLGSILIALILRAAYVRPSQKQFNLYADEFQRFATVDCATLLEEARKYGIATTIAHQNRGQLDAGNKQLETNLKDRTRSVANLIAFKINSKDADELAGEFDTTPIRTKKVKKMRTEPVYRKWNEEVWKSNEAEQAYTEVETAWQQAVTKLTAIQNQLWTIGSGLDEALHYSWKEASSETKAEMRRELLQALANNAPLTPNRHAWDRLFELPVAYFFEDIGIRPYWLSKSGKPDTEYYPPNQLTRRGLVRLGKRLQKTITVKGKLAGRTVTVYQEGYYLKTAAAVPYCAFARTLLPYYSSSPIKEIEAELLRELVPLLTPVYEQTLFWFTINPDFLITQNGEDACLALCQPPELGAERDIRPPGIVASWYPGWWLWPSYGSWDAEATFPDALSWLRTKVQKLLAQQTAYQSEVEALLKQKQGAWTSGRHTIERSDYLGEQPAKDWPVNDPSSRSEVQWYDEVEELDQTPAQRRDELANELVKLPLYTARVKITTQAGVAEHTIKTLDPKQQPDRPLFGQALHERLSRIKEQNIQDEYVRERARVEEEIRLRQEQCLQMPQLPGKQTPLPPEDEPPIFRRPPK
jgi:hypothetical protein